MSRRAVRGFAGALVLLAGLALPSRLAHGGKCGPNILLPESAVPFLPIYEQGCELHDKCLDGGYGCTTVGVCAAIRDGAWLSACDEEFGAYNPLHYLCYFVAEQMGNASDGMTCVTDQGCFSSSKVGCKEEITENL